MIERLNYPHIGLFILSWFIADITTPIIIAISTKLGIVDKPHSYKTHLHPIPNLGGLVIFIAFSISILSILRFESFTSVKPLMGISLCTVLCCIIGVADDLSNISAITKLFFLIGISLLLWFFDVQLTIFPKSLWFLNLILTVIWLAGVTSAMNSLDNMDGVATGTTGITALFLALISWDYYNYGLSGNWQHLHKLTCYGAIAILGASIGFLRYNFTPAKIFLGNNGSFLTGFLLASLTILGAWSSGSALRALVIPCALLSVPLFDITFSTISRMRHGVVKNVKDAIVYCGRDHISHRLLAMGFSKKSAILVLYLFSALAGAFSYILANPNISMKTFIMITCLGIFALLIIGAIFDNVNIYNHNSSQFEKSRNTEKE